MTQQLRNKNTITIGLDARPMQSGFKAHEGRGTGRYTTELTRGLLALHDSGALPFSISLVSPPEPSAIDAALLAALPLGKRTFESQFVYPRQVARTNVECMHFFAHGDAPSRPVIPHFVTVLDLIPLRFPQLYRAAKSNLRFRFARYLEFQAIAKATGIFAISEATKRDVVELLGVDPSRVHVTPLAVSPTFTTAPRQSLPASIAAQPADRKVLLYVGGIDPRKNVPFLLDVLAALSEQNAGVAPAAKPLLVLAGSITADDQYPLLKVAIARHGLQEQVLELGRVSEDELVSLYQRASAFLFPSLYEGFGLPVLEALACGCPVIAANNSSIPEVAGNAAVLMDSFDPRLWRDAVNELCSPERRGEIAESGPRHAAGFTWERTAQSTADGYATFLGLASELRNRRYA